MSPSGSEVARFLEQIYGSGVFSTHARVLDKQEVEKSEVEVDITGNDVTCRALKVGLYQYIVP